MIDAADYLLWLPYEASAYLRIDLQTLLRWARCGSVPGAFQLHGILWRFRRAELEAWVASGGVARQIEADGGKR
jgi:excisionase family DNA binding protein